MRPYPTPLPEPPDRRPYVRVAAGDRSLVLRVPSLHQMAQLAQGLGREEVAALAPVLSGRSPAAALAAAGPAVLEMMGALLGLAWADPAMQIETPAPRDLSPGCVRPYGAAVFEELHEEGWPLGRLLTAALVLLRETSEASQVEREVQELASFFGVRTATTSGVAPSSTPPGPASPSEAGSTH